MLSQSTLTRCAKQSAISSTAHLLAVRIIICCDIRKLKLKRNSQILVARDLLFLLVSEFSSKHLSHTMACAHGTNVGNFARTHGHELLQRWIVLRQNAVKVGTSLTYITQYP